MALQLPDVREFFWPTVDDWNGASSSRDDPKTKEDVEKIMKTSWANQAELALSKAMEIAGYEEQRRQTSEGKASTCLLVVGALIPLLTYVESIMWQSHTASAPKLLALPLLILGAAYLAATALWGLRALGVANYAVLGTGDMVRVWNEKAADVQQQLIKETLISTRYNQDVINAKVTAYKLTYAFLGRAIVAFALLLILQASFNLYRDQSQSRGGSVSKCQSG